MASARELSRLNQETAAADSGIGETYGDSWLCDALMQQRVILLVA